MGPAGSVDKLLRHGMAPYTVYGGGTTYQSPGLGTSARCSVQPASQPASCRPHLAKRPSCLHRPAIPPACLGIARACLHLLPSC